MKQREIIITTGFCIILTLVLLTGCSFSTPGKPGINPGTKTDKPVSNPADITIPLNPEYLNREIPDITDEIFTSPSSLFYDPDRKKSAYLADNFLPDDIGISGEIARIPETTALTTSPGISDTSAKTVKKTPPSPKTTTAAAAKTVPSQKNISDYEKRLAAARARKDKAFEEYTNLSTGGAKGNVEKALKEYRDAVNELKKLEAEAKK
jgi:hypothetical protein